MHSIYSVVSKACKHDSSNPIILLVISKSGITLMFFLHLTFYNFSQWVEPNGGISDLVPHKSSFL